MSDWEVIIEGDERIARRLAAFTGAELDAKLKRGLQAEGRVFARAVREAAPARIKRGVKPGFGAGSSARAGDLYRSIKSKTLRGSPPAVAVGPMAPFRHLAIAPTRAHDIAPRRLPFLVVFGRFVPVVHHPGNRAHPWVAAGIAAGRERAFAAARRAILRATEPLE